MANPSGGNAGSGGRGGNAAGVGGDDDRMGRLVLARMKTLEESFADVVRGMKVLQTSQLPSAAASGVSSAVQTSDDEAVGTRGARRSAVAGGWRELGGRGKGGKRRRTRTAEERFRPEKWRSLTEEKRAWTPEGGTGSRWKGKGRIGDREGEGSDVDDDRAEDETEDVGEEDEFLRKGSSL